jgi:hypothetical protein
MLRRSIVWTLLASLLLAPTLTLAHGDDHHHGEAAAEERLTTLEEGLTGLEEGAPAGNPSSYEERLKALEERQAEIYHTLAEKKAAGLASQIAERLTISGLIEVEAAAESVELADGSSDAASDLALATAQLGLGVKLTEEVRGNISLLFEEGAFGDEDSDLEVDEAAIDINYAPLFARAGRLYVPFGVFHSHFISDPLTLELGETRETALLLGYGHDLFSVSAFAFNGDAEKRGEEDHVRDWGASLVLTPAEGIELGASYLADLADSNAELISKYTRRVGGWSAFAVVERGPFGVSGEVLGATRSFAAADLDADGNGKGDKPLAWNLEVSWALRENVELALRYEGSDELAGQPEAQYGADASWSPWEHVTLSLEYLRGEFDKAFGDGLDQRDLVTAQLAFEF